jgi:hypothetical protein
MAGIWCEIARDREEARPGEGMMAKKALNLVLEDRDILELMRILMDDDAEGALTFLKDHFKGKARDLLEGG